MPFFCAWAALWVDRQLQEQTEIGEDGTIEEGAAGFQFTMVGGVLPVPVLAFIVTLPAAPLIWCSTKHNRMPKSLRDAFVVPAFVSSVLWFDVAAAELVDALRAFGLILDFPLSILGVTVLAVCCPPPRAPCWLLLLLPVPAGNSSTAVEE